MSTGRGDRVLRIMLLSMFLSGCASSGAPAPVEQRHGMQERTRAAHAAGPAARVEENSYRSEVAETRVQLSGLGSESATHVPPQTAVARPGVDLPSGEIAQPSAAVAAPEDQASSSAVEPAIQFPVANPAVVALLNRADRDAAAGRQGASASSLERAIKIEPGNAWLWHRLAQTRLQQNQPGEAASIAARSNSLAGDNDALRARNWRLIARVHRLRGESVAAQAAQRKAESLQRSAS